MPVRRNARKGTRVGRFAVWHKAWEILIADQGLVELRGKCRKSTIQCQELPTMAEPAHTNEPPVVIAWEINTLGMTQMIALHTHATWIHQIDNLYSAQN